MILIMMFLVIFFIGLMGVFVFGESFMFDEYRVFYVGYFDN